MKLKEIITVAREVARSESSRYKSPYQSKTASMRTSLVYTAIASRFSLALFDSGVSIVLQSQVTDMVHEEILQVMKSDGYEVQTWPTP